MPQLRSIFAPHWQRPLTFHNNNNNSSSKKEESVAVSEPTASASSWQSSGITIDTGGLSPITIPTSMMTTTAPVVLGAPDPELMLSRSFETISDNSAHSHYDDDDGMDDLMAFHDENPHRSLDDDEWSDPAGDAIPLQEDEEQVEFSKEEDPEMGDPPPAINDMEKDNENQATRKSREIQSITKEDPFEPEKAPPESMKEPTISTTTTTTTVKSNPGISIPSFLQPLLGLDFVPFLKKEEEEEKPAKSTLPSRHPINLALLEKEEEEVTSVSDTQASQKSQTSLETAASTEKKESAAPSLVQDDDDDDDANNNHNSAIRPQEEEEDGNDTKPTEDKIAWKVRRRQRRQKWRGRRFVGGDTSKADPPTRKPSSSSSTEMTSEEGSKAKLAGSRIAIAKRIQKIQAARKKSSGGAVVVVKSVDAPTVVTPVTSKDEDDDYDDEEEDQDDKSNDVEVQSFSILAKPFRSYPERRVQTASSPSFSRIASTTTGSLNWRISQQRQRRPSLMSRSTPLGQQVRDMTALRRQAKVVRLRAGNIEERIASLQDEADALFLALQRTEARLQEEGEILKVTQGELKDVEDKCLTAVQALQEEIAQARKDHDADTIVGTTPSTPPQPRLVEDDDREQEDVTNQQRPSSWVTAAATTATIARTMFTATATVASPVVTSSRPASPVITRRSVSPIPFSSRLRTSTATPPPFPRWRSSSSLLRRSSPSFSLNNTETNRPPMFRRARAGSDPSEAARRSAMSAWKTSPAVPREETAEHARPRAASDASPQTRKPEIVSLPQPAATATSLSTPFSGHTHIRMNDLEIDQRGWTHAPASLIESFPDNKLKTQDLFLMEDLVDLKLLLKQLAKLGLETATDEREERFNPTWETQRALKQHVGVLTHEPHSDWAFAPWYEVQDFESVLVWAGSSQYNGYGHGWPMIKARGNVCTSPRKLLDFLLDSNQVKKYNQMNVTRENVALYQSGVDTVDDDGKLEGDVRVWRSVNKPKMISKTLETTSLCYSKPLADGAYLIVNRSIWEDEMESPASQVVGGNMIRSEILLGVQLIRPTQAGHCELTTVTHMCSPGIPELMAKRMAPTVAGALIREIQKVFGGKA